MDDRAIIELYLSRNEDAIRQTEKKYSGYLTAVAHNILKNNEDSAECVNDTYLKTWNSIPPAEPPQLKYYLAGILRRLCIDRWRKLKVEKRFGSEYELSLEELKECGPAVSGANSPEAAAEGRLLSRAISDYLRSVKSEARDVFVMRYYFCDSVKDIAKYCDMSESKVKSLLFRTRAGLKEHLEKTGFTI